VVAEKKQQQEGSQHQQHFPNAMKATRAPASLLLPFDSIVIPRTPSILSTPRSHLLPAHEGARDGRTVWMTLDA
jgi:hypothetical protein